MIGRIRGVDVGHSVLRAGYSTLWEPGRWNSLRDYVPSLNA